MKAIWKFSVVMGLFSAVVSFIGSYMQFNGIGSYVLPSILIFLIYILIFVGSIWYIRRRQSGIISFTQALLITAIITVVGTVLSMGASYIYGCTFSDAEKNRIVDKIVDETLYDNYFSDRDELEHEDQLRKNHSVMFDISMAGVIAIMGTMTFLGIIGLVVALIMKKEPPLGQVQIGQAQIVSNE